jgi:AraC family transcriptional regulator
MLPGKNVFCLSKMFDISTLPFALSRPPVLSSANAGWENIQLAVFEQSPCEIAKHRLQYHAICINLGNPVILEQCINGISQAARSVWGDMSFYHADLWQTFCWDKETKFLQLYFEPTFLQKIKLELEIELSLEELTLLAHQDKLVLQIANALKSSLEDGSGCKFYAESMALSLAAHILNSSQKNSSKIPVTGGLNQKQIQAVTEYVSHNLQSNLSLSELAACIALSPYHFARLFKQTTGITPHQFIIHQRVELAKELLRQNKLSVTEVAIFCGFAHQGHLSRHFKRLLGVTPANFRNNF